MIDLNTHGQQLMIVNSNKIILILVACKNLECSTYHRIYISS